MSDEALLKAFAEMQGKIERMERELDRLRSREEISEVLNRLARASDRRDPEMLATCFHPGAMDYRGAANGPFENLSQLMENWNVTESRHCISNISIRLEDESAKTECYVTDYHHVPDPQGGLGQDEFVQARYLDLFARRDGVWKIARRITVWDRSWTAPSRPSWYDAVTEFVPDSYFIFGRRDKDDLYYSYALPEALRHYEPDAEF
jgi:SnoaL-like domain